MNINNPNSKHLNNNNDDEIEGNEMRKQMETNDKSNYTYHKHTVLEMKNEFNSSFSPTLHSNEEDYLLNYVNDIFLFKKPELFFGSLNNMMTLLSLYLALWITDYSFLNTPHWLRVSTIKF